MDVYLSEEEQWEKIKEFWKKYGNTIFFTVLLCLGLTFGWRYWHVYKTKRAENASLLYSQLITLDMLHKSTEVPLFADNIIKNYSATPYASLAAFITAKYSVKSGDLAQGLQKLQWVIAKSSNASFRQIARIRAARILLAQKKPQEALEILKVVDDAAYNSAINEAIGDVYFKMGQKAEALAYYKKAIKGVKQNNVVIAILQMKIDQLQG